jgi:hypothetical protein
MSADSLREILTGLGIQWQALTIHETKRGRFKPIVTGIPGSLFWHRYKHGLRSQMTAAGLTLRRLTKNNWEVICWPRPASIPILAELGFKMPEVQNPGLPF